MRVLTRPIAEHGRRVGTLHDRRPAEPGRTTRRPACCARSRSSARSRSRWRSRRDRLIATLIARAAAAHGAVAAAVDAGDLSLRAGAVGARGEVGVLASAFDHMLERLERAFARQRDFVSDASHELRTPLAVLRAQVELLDRETDEQRTPRGHASRSCDGWTRWTASSTTCSRWPAPRRAAWSSRSRSSSRTSSRTCVATCRCSASATSTSQPVDGVLDADPDRLTQVLRNLVRNAVAHTEPGWPHRRRRRACEASGCRSRSATTDPGIPPEHLEHVFERFYRAEESRSRDSGGSGLGLAIARAIVEAHGGRIWAESRAGAGTTITLELPGL